MSKPRLCLTCSSTLAEDGSSSQSLPSSSEKPYLPPVTFECEHIVCGTCVRQNRRLARGCILCQNVNDVLAAGTSKEGRKGTPRSGKELPAYQESMDDGGDFVIGSDEEDEGQMFDEEKPPMFEEDPPMYDDTSKPTRETQDVKRDQNSVHYIRPEETLRGLALKYKIDGHLLCSLNKLPTSTLTTIPHLLHTLPFLLLPPTAESSSTTPIHSPLEERRRLVLRRFQVHTRCAEWALASAYVNPIFAARDKELEMIKANRMARGEDVEGLLAREGGELEEAIESWDRDQKWENEHIKGKGIVGSKIKSTGMVERSVKSWTWK